MTNKLTLLTDGGFLLQSRMFRLERGFNINNPDRVKQSTAEEFKSLLAQSIAHICRQFPEIDNVILTSEGGSWRKQVPIPKSLGTTTYKGHRQRREELDWDCIYKAFKEFAEGCKAAGMTVSQHFAIEGDDWIWYWSRRLNAEGISTLIYSTDCDLKQLVQVNGSAFTAWWNPNAGLVIPNECKWPEDPVEAMLNPPFQHPLINALIKDAKSGTPIRPDEIAINKILCGDAGDNIKSVVRYQKGTRTYRFAQKDYEDLIEKLDIRSVVDLISRKREVAEYIAKHKKFAPYGFNPDEIVEMLDYNTKMVWLNESVIPDTVTTAMVQIEYKVIDCIELRNNYKILLPQDEAISDIFAGVNY